MDDKRDLKLYKLPEPREWVAGRVGDRELYFDCGSCEAKAPVIYGHLGCGRDFDDIAVRQAGDGVSRLMLLCRECYERHDQKIGQFELRLLE